VTIIMESSILAVPRQEREPTASRSNGVQDPYNSTGTIGYAKEAQFPS
jgi:hypothetical protein